jgi:DNA polymerase III subunit delta
MGALTFDALFRGLKKGAVDPVYYLYGDEDVLKQEAIQALLEHALDASTRDFNLDQRDIGSLDAEAFHALVQTPPMMASRRVVLLRGVEQLRKKSKARDELLRYLAAPNPDTILILVQAAGTDTEADILRHATAVELDRLPPERVRRWIDRRAAQLALKIEPAAADLLLAAVGADLGAAAQELDKLAGLAQGRTITALDLAVVAGVSPGETVPDLVAAVLGRDVTRAAKLLRPVLEQAGVSGVRVLSALGTAMIGVALARAELDRGTPPARAPGLVFRHIETARPAGLGSWRDTAQRWTGWAAAWTAADLRRGLRLALEADTALKNSTVSDEVGIVLDLILRLAVPAEVGA